MKKNIVLIGAGGHSRACIDVIEETGNFHIVGIVDANQIGPVLGYQVLGNDDELTKIREYCESAIVAVGQIDSAKLRTKLFNLAKQLKFDMPAIVSPYSRVSKYSRIEEGTIIMHGAIVNASAAIGKNCIINSMALIEHDATIQDHCHVATGAIINGSVMIKRGTFVGSNAVVIQNATSEENDFIKAGAIYKGCK